MAGPKTEEPDSVPGGGGRGNRRAGAGGAEGALVTNIGPFQIDWPRSAGFFGGIALAVGLGVIDPPLGVFIAAVPFLKMLDLPRLPTPARLVGQVVEGIAKPVGGDSQGTVRIVTAKGSSDQPVANEG